MSVEVRFDNVIKRYGSKTVIPGLEAKVRKGEFFTLLGPSGCGKTTLLRMVIGFNSIEGGSIFFNDRLVNDMPPNKRNIGMVFQNYAVFPHMTVAQNVAFGLKNRKYSKQETAERVDEILKSVKIDALRDVLPENMSGGQQQRVALARAIVIRPDILLMDEPLSNLDAKLRVEMRSLIREIQHSVGITTIYVTHDQEEALAISDRIAVMNEGVIEHLGNPENIYLRPANLFVATFIGRSNVLTARLVNEDSRKKLIFPDGYTATGVDIRSDAPENCDVKVVVRPEDFIFTDGEGMRGTVSDSIFLGGNTHYFIHTNAGEKLELVQESGIKSRLSQNSKIYMALKLDKINVFDAASEKSLMEGVINDASGEA